jgi:hypothetical protein
MLLFQIPWIELLATMLLVGLLMFLVYFGMFRFESGTNFYLFWTVIGLFTVFGVYFALRAEAYILFFGQVPTTVFLFIRDLRKMNRLMNKN